MSTYAKYADMYKQRLARSQDARLNESAISPSRSAKTTTSPLRENRIPNHIKNGTDRSTYMTFLEVQLERVTQACMTSLSFQQKFDQMQSNQTSQEEKISNVGRLVKLLQSYTEAQEEDVVAVKQSVKNLNLRLDEVVAIIRNQNGGQYLNQSSPTRKQRSLSRDKQLEERIRKIEQNIASAPPRNLVYDSKPNLTESLNTYDEHHRSNSDVNNLVSEVDKSMKEIEERIYRHLEEHTYATNMRVDDAVRHFDQKIAEMQNHLQSSMLHSQRKKVIEASQLTGANGGFNPQKMEAALNDWLGKVEEQVNQIEEMVQSKAPLTELDILENKLTAQFNQISELSTRVAEDAVHSQQSMQQKMFELDDRFRLMQRHMEAQLKNRSNSRVSSHNNSKEAPTSLNADTEKKIIGRVSDSINQLGDIIAEQGRKQRKHGERLADLETKIFGNPREVLTKKVKAEKTSVSTKRPSLEASKRRIHGSSNSLRKSHGSDFPVKESRSTKNVMKRDTPKVEPSQSNTISHGLQEEPLKDTFEQRLGAFPGTEAESPRTMFKRVRDRSIRELSASLTRSRQSADNQRSPLGSSRLKEMVEIVQSSPHVHTGIASAENLHRAKDSLDISNKNFLSNIERNNTAAAFEQRQASTGYLTEQRIPHIVETVANEDNKRRSRKTTLSSQNQQVSQDNFTLKDLEKRDRANRKKASSRGSRSRSKSRDIKRLSRPANRSASAKRSNSAKRVTSNDRKISNNTFNQMKSLNKNLTIKAATIDKENLPANRQTSNKRSDRASKGVTPVSRQHNISPNRGKAVIKTTKPKNRPMSAHSRKSSRSKSASQRGRRLSSHHKNCTAAQELFNNSIESDSNIPSLVQAGLDVKEERQSRSRSRPSKRDKAPVPRVALKAKIDQVSLRLKSPTGNNRADSTKLSTAKEAKRKLKNLQNKKSNVRLARLERMYQELTDIEQKGAKI